MTASSKTAKRAPAWRYREVVDLLAIWGEKAIQQDLKSNRRNIDIYDNIAQAMRRLGHSRTAEECRQKAKSLKHEYKKAVSNNSMSGNTRHVCQFFSELENILGMDASVMPPRMSRAIDLEVVREGGQSGRQDSSGITGMSGTVPEETNVWDTAIPSSSYEDLQTVEPRDIAVPSTSNGGDYQRYVLGETALPVASDDPLLPTPRGMLAGNSPNHSWVDSTEDESLAVVQEDLNSPSVLEDEVTTCQTQSSSSPINSTQANISPEARGDESAVVSLREPQMTQSGQPPLSDSQHADPAQFAAAKERRWRTAELSPMSRLLRERRRKRVSDSVDLAREVVLRTQHQDSRLEAVLRETMAIERGRAENERRRQEREELMFGRLLNIMDSLTEELRRTSQRATENATSEVSVGTDNPALDTEEPAQQDTMSASQPRGTVESAKPTGQKNGVLGSGKGRGSVLGTSKRVRIKKKRLDL